MGTHFGGTWEAYGSGRVLVAKSADTEFDTIGETGGVKDVTLTSAQSGVPAHKHPFVIHNAGSGSLYAAISSATAVDNASTENNTAANASEAHTNLQPYIVVYRYRRTA
jgi:microcystin-dependent protein